jgi:hypothetical protein
MDGATKVTIGRVMLLSAIVMAALGMLLLGGVLSVGGDLGITLGVVLLSVAAVDAVVGVRFLVSHTR